MATAVVELCNTYSLEQLVTSPSRVTMHSESIIDLILTTVPHKHTLSGVIPVTMSDHYMVFSILREKLPREKIKYVSKRNYNYFNVELFLYDIAFSNVFSSIFHCCDVTEARELWLSEYIRICQKHAPINTHKIRDRNNPWVTPAIRQMMYDRDYWHKQATTTKNPNDMINYRILRNKVTCAIRNEKKHFVEIEIQQNEGQPDKAWRALKYLLPTKNKVSTSTSNLDANTFNSFFSSVGNKTTEHFGNIMLPDFNIPQVNDSFLFTPLEEHFVIRQLLKLPNSTSLDQTNLDNYSLRLAAHLIAPCLTNIFNLSLNSGCVPDSWKSASITPIYKGKGDRSECGNYRPISIIPTVAKIIECHVKENLVNFLAHHHLLSPSQYAYTKGISTEMALHTLVDDTLINMDKGKVTVACMLDLRKGFDTVCHEILLHKLHFYGIKIYVYSGSSHIL